MTSETRQVKKHERVDAADVLRGFAVMAAANRNHRKRLCRHRHLHRPIRPVLPVAAPPHPWSPRIPLEESHLDRVALRQEIGFDYFIKIAGPQNIHTLKAHHYSLNL